MLALRPSVTDARDPGFPPPLKAFGRELGAGMTENTTNAQAAARTAASARAGCTGSACVQNPVEALSRYRAGAVPGRMFWFTRNTFCGS
jgi:hypothetical protein